MCGNTDYFIPRKALSLHTHTHTHTESINQSCRVHGQHTKLAVFLYTSNEQSKKEIEKTTPFTITSKGIKYPGINLTKEMKDLCNENYQILMKGIEEDTSKTTDILCSWIGRIDLLK